MTDREKSTAAKTFALRSVPPEQRQRIEAIIARWPARPGMRSAEFRHTLRQTIAELVAAWHGEWLDADSGQLRKTLLRCEHGHVWNAKLRRLHCGRWCPVCHSYRNTLEEMQALAETRGGKCLSTEYLHAHAKLLWQCANGHQWQANLSNVQHGGRWCPVCAIEQRKHDLPMMQALAASKGGRCLSKEYINGSHPLRWQCSQGHIWSARPEQVLSHGTWCRRCYNERQLGTIEQMQAVAKERGGQCLSTKYEYCYNKLQWQCGEGHIWWATPSSVTIGESWCLQCSRLRRRRQTLAELQELAISRGGRCLSTERPIGVPKLQWQCHLGHTWYAMPASICRGTWCRQCANLALCKNEKKQRKYLPNWRHGRMEGDGEGNGEAGYEE
jgi:hypothetical protein